jgi:DNA-directed RNA polymerase specialized sigma24 family protein
MPYERDTRMGGGAARFPVTRHSAIFSTRSDDVAERERAYSAIVAGYWKPVYKYIRVQWNKGNEDAKDLTQSFFLQAMEKSWFGSYDQGKGSFRNFVRTCVDGFVSKQNDAAQRLKRGGGVAMVPLDFETAEGELQALPLVDGMSTEEFFHREWVRHLFSGAVDQLKSECDAAGKQTHFLLLERYDLDQTSQSYAELAVELGLPVSQVTNYLAWARRQFRRIVLDRIREISGSDEEFEREARHVLGGSVK